MHVPFLPMPIKHAHIPAAAGGQSHGAEEEELPLP